MYQPNPYTYNSYPAYRPLQPIQTIQPQSQCYFVGSKEEMQTLQPVPNTYYIGINRAAKEVYVKAWNNDGNIDFDTYKIPSSTEGDSLEKIYNKLTSIEEKIDDRNANATANVGNIAKQSEYANIQSNDERKNTSATVSDSAEHSKIKRNGY